jgi:hypothetical protein
MNVAFGIKAHSGWAALVVVGRRGGGEVVVVDRRRVELVEEVWAKQPYHAAETLTQDAARELVERGVEAAHRIALREMQEALRRERERNHRVTGCAVLMSDPMPAWSTDQILSVHFRMHKAEGVLFREALARAADACGLKVVRIPEKLLAKRAAETFGTAAGDLVNDVATLGKSIGPPWGKDQKEAALAALVALEG